MPRILVTGARGFVGRSVIAPLLGRKFEVHGVTRERVEKSDQVRYHRADLLVPGEAARVMDEVRPTHLIHLAWHLPVGAYRQAGGHARWIGATCALVQAFADAGGKRFVGVGTCAEYAPGPEPLSEVGATLAPRDAYGRAKDTTRRALDAYAEENGVEAAWARLFSLHGPHESPARLVPSIVRALLAGERALCSPGTQVRDYLHVEDAADALAALVDSHVGGALNVASGEGVQVAHVARRVSELMGRPELLQLGARPLPPDESPFVVAEVARLRRELGWKPAHDLEAGLIRTVAWWKQDMEASS
jgi:nucleoside-diphosphate-sugar epimerase